MQLSEIKKVKKEKLIQENISLSPIGSSISLKKYQKFSLENLQKIEQDLNHANKVNQKLYLYSLQKHLSLIKLEEIILVIAFITAGVLGRTLLQGFPSVEPITFFAILAGSLLGWKKGAVTGATSWYLSNFFVFGGQGPWTAVHVANGAIAGFLGGIFLQKLEPKPFHYIKTIFIMIISTIIFEITINTMSGLLFYGIIISFLTAIPFIITHLASNIVFSLLTPKTRKEIYEKGKLNEREICEKFIAKLKSLQSRNETKKSK